jgi:hypothetical protein
VTQRADDAVLRLDSHGTSSRAWVRSRRSFDDSKRRQLILHRGPFQMALVLSQNTAGRQNRRAIVLRAPIVLSMGGFTK